MHKATKLIAICTAACGLSLFATGCETLGAKDCSECTGEECTTEECNVEECEAEECPAEKASMEEEPG